MPSKLYLRVLFFFIGIIVLLLPSAAIFADTVVFTGSLEGETNPYDDYSFFLTAGQTITVDHVCAQDGGSPSSPTTPLDPTLQILTLGGTVLAEDDDGGTILCAQSRSSRLVFTAPSSGIYIIRATSYEFITNDYTDPNADGDYILTITGITASSPGSVTYYGTLEGETNPYDDYSFFLTSGQTITVDHVCAQDGGSPSSPTTPLDPTLQILTLGGTVLAEDDDGGTILCAQSRSSRLVFTAPSSGTYIIRATSYEFITNDYTDPNADGDYILTITGITSDIPPTIISPASASLQVNTTLNHRFEASGVPLPNFSYSNINLPPGVSLLGNSLSGVPTVPGNYSMVVTASNGVLPNAMQTFSLTVIGTPPTITSAASASVPADAPFSHTFTASGNPAPTFAYSNENLPPGVTRTVNTLSGTPTVPGDYSINVTASNGFQPNASQTFTIRVNPTPPTITSAASASVPADAPFSHTFTASGNPISSLSYANENLPPGVTRTVNTLSGTPTVPGDYSIDVTASNGIQPNALQTFTIRVNPTPPNITSAGTASVAANIAFDHTFTASGNPAPTFSYANEVLPPGITRTGNMLSGSATAVGTYSIDVTASNGAVPNAMQTFIITVTGDAPTISSEPNASVEANIAFSHTFTAAGNPIPVFSYANENLPPGVTRTDDTLSGTPTAPGTYTIDVTASNGVIPVAMQTFTINVTGTAPTITNLSAVSAVVDVPFTFTITAAGNPVPTLSYTNENLPPGVTRTGDVLSGSPTALGIYTIDITAANTVTPDAMQTLTITVTGEAPVITSAASIIVTVNNPFSHTFAAVGSPAPTLTYADENLPSGVTRTGNTLSGKPTVVGTYTITVTASNGETPDAVQVFSLIVDPGPPPPPPAPVAEDMNFEDSDAVRTGIPSHLFDSINIRVLYENGAPVQWLGNDLYNAGSIGIQGVLNLGVRQAIDIFSNHMTYFEGGAVFCLQGQGTLIWMAGKNNPRIAEIIGSYTVPEFPGYTCATLFEPGTLVLVTGTPGEGS